MSTQSSSRRCNNAGLAAEPAEQRRRGPRRRHSLAARALMICAAFVAVSVIGTETFFLEFFRRRDVPDITALTYADIDAARYVRQEISFPSGPNTLAGYYYPNAAGRALVLVAHGLHSSADHFLPVITWLLDHDYAVLAFDAAACGKSTGSMIGLEQMRFDIEAAIDCTVTLGLPADEPLLLFGHSMGGYGAAAALGEKSDRVRGVVCIAGFDQPQETMIRWAARYVGPLVAVEAPFLMLHDAYTPGTDATLSAWETIRRTGVPVLAVQGANDERVMADCSLYQKLLDKPLPNVETLLVSKPEASGHSNLLLTEESARLQHQWLRDRSGRGPTHDDRLAMNVLDEQLMETMHTFMLQCLK